MTIVMVASACGGSSTTVTGSSDGDGAATGSGGTRSDSGDGGVTSSGGTSTGGIPGSGGTVGSGGAIGTGGMGTGGVGTGGTTICPPCVAPPSPDCVGTGPCGCGPYVCPDAGPPPGYCGGVACGAGTVCCGPPECGHCVPENSGVYCPDYCEYCGGDYLRSTGSTLCTGEFSVLWEVSSTVLSPFYVPECQDAGTNLPRFCCTSGFVPACP